MANTKEIQRRIKSIKSTQKVTKAMEMVAAAKMRKAIEAVIKTRTYANLSWGTVLNLSNAVNNNGGLHPLFAKKEKIKSVCIVLIASNRGLCGGYNTNIINKVHKSIQKHHHSHSTNGEAVKTEFILIGKKGSSVHRYYNYDIVAEFTKQDAINEIKEVIPVAKMAVKDYLSGKYDKVMVAFTDFISATKQIPRVKQLLPVEIGEEEDFLGIVGGDTRVGINKELVEKKQEKYLSSDLSVNSGLESFKYNYIFEPNAEEVLDEMAPRLIEIQLYQALLESNASEHSARMQAMHKANDAAKELVEELTLYFNKTRQASITAEIAEISAGANALAE